MEIKPKLCKNILESVQGEFPLEDPLAARCFEPTSYLGVVAELGAAELGAGTVQKASWGIDAGCVLGVLTCRSLECKLDLPDYASCPACRSFPVPGTRPTVRPN